MKTTRYELNMTRPELAQGAVRLAFLTDLHNAENGTKNEELLEAIRHESPDLILCGGDMIVAKPGHSLQVAEELIKKLAEDYPIYYAFGNHEGKLKQYPHEYGPVFEAYQEELEKAGVTFLDNASELITVRGIAIQLLGYTIPKRYYHRLKRYHMDSSELDDALGTPNDDAISILMAHHPSYLEAYSNWGADLILCGHNHGGMIRIGKNRGFVTPNLHFFSDSCYGHFDFHARKKNGSMVPHEHHVIIGAGLGEHTFPLRVNNPRELVIMDLCVNIWDDLQ